MYGEGMLGRLRFEIELVFVIFRSGFFNNGICMVKVFLRIFVLFFFCKVRFIVVFRVCYVYYFFL